MANYQRNERILYVANRFTFWGFIFAWGWLFSRGLWLQALIVLVIYIPIYFFHSIFMLGLTRDIQAENYYLLVPFILLFFIHLIVGFKGPVWLRDSVQRRGYKKIS